MFYDSLLCWLIRAVLLESGPVASRSAYLALPDRLTRPRLVRERFVGLELVVGRSPAVLTVKVRRRLDRRRPAVRVTGGSRIVDRIWSNLFSWSPSSPRCLATDGASEGDLVPQPLSSEAAGISSFPGWNVRLRTELISAEAVDEASESTN